MSNGTDDEEEFNEALSYNVTTGPRGLSTDKELTEWLSGWKVSEPSRLLDLRVMAAYRNRNRTAVWRRFIASSISVPVPIAAAAVLLLFGSGLFSTRLLRNTPRQAAEPAPLSASVIEVPVLQDRIVTHTIYVQNGKAKQARSNARARIVDGTAGEIRPTQDNRPAGGSFTLADLSGFEPVSQMRIEVIKGAKTNED